jgi:hypothetical protein
MRTITVNINELAFKEGSVCILTGQPNASMRVVTLRRMWFVGAAWVGESVNLKLPLALSVNYAVTQYLRCFRWVICLLAPIPVTANLELTLDYQWVKGVAYLGIAVATWFGIGAILKSEKIRLIKGHKGKGVVTLGFSAPDALTRFESQRIPEGANGHQDGTADRRGMVM